MQPRCLWPRAVHPPKRPGRSIRCGRNHRRRAFGRCRSRGLCRHDRGGGVGLPELPGSRNRRPHLRGRGAAGASGAAAGRARPHLGAPDLRGRRSGPEPGEGCLRASAAASRRREPARNPVGRGADAASSGRIGLRNRPEEPRRLFAERAFRGRRGPAAGIGRGKCAAGRSGDDAAADRERQGALFGARAGDRRARGGEPHRGRRRRAGRPCLHGRADREERRGESCRPIPTTCGRRFRTTGASCCRAWCAV